MKVRNTSPYDTRVIRRVLVAVKRAWIHNATRFGEDHADLFKALVVECVPGRTNRVTAQWAANTQQTNRLAHILTLRLPKLTGDEFVPLWRQHHGGEQGIKAGLNTTELALLLQQCYYGIAGKDRKKWMKERLVGGPDTVKGLPQFVPLKIIQPKEGAPRDIVAERHARVLELEQKWQRKLKLAQTKLKKLRAKRKHYEKKLKAREDPA